MRFEDALRLAGLIVEQVVADGRWHRCPTIDHPRKKNGAWKLMPDRRLGFLRNWADGRGLQHWSDGTDYVPTAVDLERQRKEREAQRRHTLEGIRAARELWASARQYRVHPYLSNKGLSAEGCHVLRLWDGALPIARTEGEGDKMRTQWDSVHDTWLVVPLYWRDRLVSVQRIGTHGIKRQMKGAPQKGCSLILGRPRWAVTVFCEGLATGLAIYQTVRNARVVVCFFSDNLVPVVQELKPSGSVVFAADNDWQTALKPHMHGVNPGIKAAKNAAELVGCGVAWPEGIEGSDWADALKEWGQQGARRIERLILKEARYVAAPG